MSFPTQPLAWANRLTLLMNAAIGTSENRFPIDVSSLALDYSRHVFREDPIVRVDGAPLGKFEGCLRHIPELNGWGILHNTGVSEGRARFTLAHEFGHYLLHRALAGGAGGKLLCTSDDIAKGSINGRNIEREANAFAAALLMPLDDFRAQLPARAVPDLDILSACADRYGTSLVATTLKWLSYTECRAALVVATDDFVNWAVSSEPACRTGAFLRTKGTPPIDVHPASLLSTGLEDRTGVVQDAAVWFGEESREMTLIPDGYGFGMSLVLLGDAPEREWSTDGEDDALAQPVDHRMRAG